MKRSIFTACLVTMPLLGVGCSGDPADEGDESNLPGDIDNSTAGAGEKQDAWDYRHDPAKIASNLQYRLSMLPKNGKLDKPVWADRFPDAVGKAPIAWSDTYWPSAQLSSNVRWQGPSQKSPLEKYDAAFNGRAGCDAQPASPCGTGAKAAWDTYLACAGPAAKWHMQNFQSISQMFDGVDNDRDGQIDECDSNDDEGPQGWWGLCHAWTPAALLEPEPQKAVTYNGQTFEVADIKALIQTVYDRNEAIMIGGRCNAKEFTPTPNTSANDDCSFNAGTMHVVLANVIGINDGALAMDKTATYEVWNQPIIEYSVTQQDKVSATRAMSCVGGTGNKYTFNTSAQSLYEVTTTVKYLVEGSASTRPLGMTSYISSETYHYILEVGTGGKVIGGRFCTDTEGPDFMWAPIRVSPSSHGRNPNIALEHVRTLINLSLSDAPPPSGTGREYEVAPARAIPDNDPAGASATIDVPDSFSFKSLSVSIDLQHSYRGDLRVELHRDATKVATLHDGTGGSAHDLTATYTLTPAQLGGSAARGSWTLKVVDTAAQDTGTIKLFKLAFVE
jgi:hypothetical protein